VISDSSVSNIGNYVWICLLCYLKHLPESPDPCGKGSASRKQCLDFWFCVVSNYLIELESGSFGLHFDPFSFLEMRGKAFVIVPLIRWHLIILFFRAGKV